MPPTRITIRLSPTLAARLTATVGPRGTLADLVRHAIEAYLENEPSFRQPTAGNATATADVVTATADTLAAVQDRLEAVEQRLTALEAVAVTGSRRQPSRPPVAATTAATPTPHLLGPYDPHAAVARIQALRAQGLSLARIADQLTAEGVPTRYGLPWQHSSVRHLLKTYG